MSSKIFWVVIAVLIIGPIGYAISRPNDSGTEPQAQITSFDDERLNDLVLHGDQTSLVTVVEYSDFECPACANMHVALKDIESEFGNDVRVIFRHNPLISIHKSALSAHKVAEAAAKQSKFVETHDLLFEQRQQWVDSSNPQESIFKLMETANIELDYAVLKQDILSSATNDAIEADLDSGKANGVNSTPTLFIDGQKADFDTLEELRSLIQTKLNTAKEQ